MCDRYVSALDTQPQVYSPDEWQLWWYRPAAAGCDTWSPCRRSYPQCRGSAAVPGWCDRAGGRPGQPGRDLTASAPQSSGTEPDHWRIPEPRRQQSAAVNIRNNVVGILYTRQTLLAPQNVITDGKLLLITDDSKRGHNVLVIWLYWVALCRTVWPGE